MVSPHLPAGCGQCMPCRIRRQMLWSHRMMLESYKHAASSFLTLTYDDDHIPSDGSLCPRDLNLWFKRFRAAVSPTKIRFYAVGEYGDESQRPHYHAALFGVGPETEALCSQTWRNGFAYLAELNETTARYICGYVLKKMTKSDDPRLNGRHPEFARMSLKPGIGATAVSDISETLFSQYGRETILETGDVPRTLLHGKHGRPLGRYLRQKIRDDIGMPDSFKEANKAAYQAEMQSLWQNYCRDPSFKKEEVYNLKTLLLRNNLQNVRNIESRLNIRTSGKKSL